MKNGSHKSHKRTSLAARVVAGIGAVAASLLLLRALPDLVRYLRIRRM